MKPPAIRHVMFDADDVLQYLPGGWFVAMEPYLGNRSKEFLLKTWKDELPMLAGKGDYMAVLGETLKEFGVSSPVEKVYADVWQNIVLVDETVEVIRALRRNGYRVHLGTNQEQYRANHMRSTPGFNELFDVSCYSCELGVMKPDPKFFTMAAERIGSDPSSILFIDDRQKNIDGRPPGRNGCRAVGYGPGSRGVATHPYRARCNCGPDSWSFATRS